jgi:hypothetical protein
MRLLPYLGSSNQMSHAYDRSAVKWSRRGEEWCSKAAGSDVTSATVDLMIVGLFPQSDEGDTTMDQSRRAHRSARPLHSPKGANPKESHVSSGAQVATILGGHSAAASL